MQISIRALLIASVLYLLIPFCIFLFGWVHPFIVILFAVTLLFLLFKKNKIVEGTIHIPVKTAIITGIVLFFWTLLSGAGHRGIFDGDYFKHNAILSDLISFDWPVTYLLKETGRRVHLVYYFAYYLPSALIGKYLGWKMANISLFFWTYAGIGLAFTWLLSIVEKKTQGWYCLLFPLFSGLDGIGKLIMGSKVVNGTDWEWWGRNWQYSGNTTLFFYVPQQALAGWICMGVLVFSFLKNKKLPFQELLFVSTLLWSPFIFIGIAPFYIWMIVRKKIKLEIPVLLLSLFVLATEVLFFLSNMTLSSPETNASGWLWQIEKLFGSWVLVRLGLFYLLEFGIFIIFLWKAKKISPLLIIASLILLAIPWYKIGLMNDFAMRASIPALYIVCLYWLMYLVQSKKHKIVLVFSWLVFLIGCMYPLILLGNGIVHFSFGPPRYSLAQLDQPKFRKQYLGNEDSLFFTLFRPVGTNRKLGHISLQK